MSSPSPWRVRIVTLFPELFPGPLGVSVAGKAHEAGLWSCETFAIRDYATDRHRTVDGTPAGGGPGMVMRADCLAHALDAAMEGEYGNAGRFPRLCMSARGKRFDQPAAQRLARSGGAVVLCGRFEGVDQRVIEAREMEEFSFGDCVLAGGEIAAMGVIEASLRLRPGVLGSPESLREESHAQGLLEHPHYTRPRHWEGRAIPGVLLSGDHAAIRAWREAQAVRTTREKRPDLWRAFQEIRGRTWHSAGPSRQVEDETSEHS